MSGMNWCVKLRGEREKVREYGRERKKETKGPDCLTDRQADGQELGIREYDSAREWSIKTGGGRRAHSL